MVFRIASSPYTHNQRQTSRIMLLVLLAVTLTLYAVYARFADQAEGGFGR